MTIERQPDGSIKFPNVAQYNETEGAVGRLILRFMRTENQLAASNAALEQIMQERDALLAQLATETDGPPMPMQNMNHKI